MPKTTYTSLSEVNELQTNIMKFVDIWVREKKTPIPRKEIIIKMESAGVNFPTCRAALYALIKKGYIREAYTISNKTTYVQLRRL